MVMHDPNISPAASSMLCEKLMMPREHCNLEASKHRPAGGEVEASKKRLEV